MKRLKMVLGVAIVMVAMLMSTAALAMAVGPNGEPGPEWYWNSWDNNNCNSWDNGWGNYDCNNWDNTWGTNNGNDCSWDWNCDSNNWDQGWNSWDNGWGNYYDGGINNSTFQSG